MILADDGHLEWRIKDIASSSRDGRPDRLIGKRSLRANAFSRASAALSAPRRDGRIVKDTASQNQVGQNQAGQNQAGALSDPRYLAGIRDEMRRFAMRQLRNREEAEDVVQEALVGALRNADSFRGQAALRTWIFAILRNKLADIHRQRQRQHLPAAPEEIGDALDRGDNPGPFDRRGLWLETQRPSRWDHPETDMHDRQFLAIFDACLGRLPPQQARVFMMREVLELDTEEICAELGLTAGNVHVILHRARLGLRSCLEHKWINPGA